METLPDADNQGYEVQRFTEYLHARFTDTTPRGVVMGKIPRKDLVMSFGVRVPATYEIFPDPDSVDFSRLPSRFVLKPVNLWSAEGVHLLVRQGEQFDGMRNFWHIYPKKQNRHIVDG